MKKLVTISKGKLVRTKKLNETIIIQHKLLEQVSMVKDRVLSVVGHDMRSPLNMLSSLSQLLKEGSIPPEKMPLYMSQLESTLSHTSSVMDNLLYWAASQMQGYNPVIGLVQLNPVVEDIIQLLKGNAEKKHIQISNNIPEGTVASCDPDMIALIIRNLVSNSIKFTSSHGNININALKENGFIHVMVIDNGVGMTSKSMESFNKNTFGTTESTPGTASEKGTGIGLLLCKTFIQLLNGRITVSKGTNGKGCKFEIILPHE
ncbi:MAG: HAMP domain-containing histidine kinase [Pedobacter sp.]|nr:MAG: HAMP domain-containing histidine kinase [Pedobacter sp.]